MAFIHDDFLLDGEAARRLYHDYAAAQPIVDYHCHLPVRDIAENRQFSDLFAIWLEGDHYKWRAMRANGIPERFCTGDATPWEKFEAWARTVPFTLRNPLYHWTHLELARYFGIFDLLDERSAPAIWAQANAQLSDLRAWNILGRFAVQAVCTTDDPADSLRCHEQISASPLPTRIYPTYRPDAALGVHDPAAFNAWVDRLAAAANCEIQTWPAFLEALRQRHDDFHAIGGRLSDHGLSVCFAEFPAESVAAHIFARARSGNAATPEEHRRFASFLMLYFGRLDAEKGWTKQLHLGAYRNSRQRMQALLGRDTGFDSIGDWPQMEALGAYLDRLDQEKALPKVILYNNNPADNYAFATMAANFGIQFGSGWWFLDQKDDLGRLG